MLCKIADLEKTNYDVKYSLLEFLVGILDAISKSNASGDAQKDPYADMASNPVFKKILFKWCITLDYNSSVIEFNEKHLPEYFRLFTLVIAHTPGLLCEYAGSDGHIKWVINNVLFSEFLKKPLPVSREACALLYSQALVHPDDRGTFIANLPCLTALKSNYADILWALLRLFCAEHPPVPSSSSTSSLTKDYSDDSALPTSVYSIVANEKGGFNFIISALRACGPEINDALRLAAVFISKVPLNGAIATSFATFLLPLFEPRQKTDSATTAATTTIIDNAILLKAWQSLLAQSKVHAFILRKLRGFIGAHERSRSAKDFLYGVPGFAESVHIFLAGHKTEDDALCVAFMLATMCADTSCTRLVEGGNMTLKPMLTEVQTVTKSIMYLSKDDLKKLYNETPSILTVLGAVLFSNVKKKKKFYAAAATTTNTNFVFFRCFLFYRNWRTYYPIQC